MGGVATIQFWFIVPNQNFQMVTRPYGSPWHLWVGTVLHGSHLIFLEGNHGLRFPMTFMGGNRTSRFPPNISEGEPWFTVPNDIYGWEPYFTVPTQYFWKGTMTYGSPWNLWVGTVFHGSHSIFLVGNRALRFPINKFPPRSPTLSGMSQKIGTRNSNMIQTAFY